jgi:hypothetical protein
MARFTLLVAGGYGFFGARVARNLASDPRIRLLIGGRDPARCAAAAAKLNAQTGGDALGHSIDIQAGDAARRLRDDAVHAVINTAGPFESNDYRAAQACIAAGAHYIDLADARLFVAGIGRLDAAARERGVAVIAGASTVPAVSTAVVDALAAGLDRITGVDIGISVGNRTERGLATVRSVLSYCGRPLARLEHGRWGTMHGWQDMRRHRFPAPAGARWICACDAPDLELLPRRYEGLQDVAFRAGVELSLLQWGLWALSWLVRGGLLRDPSRHAQALHGWAERLRGFGTVVGAMHVTVTGERGGDVGVKRMWTLVARDGMGPEVPITVAAILARRWAAGTAPAPGAAPCIGMVSLAEIEDAWKALPFETRTTEQLA